MIETRSQYHVALADTGLVLQGSPESPAYTVEQAVMFNSRYAQGDRGYDDFSKWWYWAQTDWFQGFKDDTSWADDGQFYYSTNIDTWSEVGAMKLAHSVVVDEDFTEDLVCGGTFEVNGVISQYVGTADNGSGRPQVYKASPGVGQTWTEISGTEFVTAQSTVSMMSARNGHLFLSLTGSGTQDAFNTYDGSGGWTDLTAVINTGAAPSYTPSSSRCHCTVGGTMYVFIDNSANNQYALVKTTAVFPNTAADWSLVFETLISDAFPIAIAEYQGTIMYMVYSSPRAELRQYNVTTNEDIAIQVFDNVSLQTYGVGARLLLTLGGKLIITLEREIWEWDGTSLNRIFHIDDYKRISINKEAYPYLGRGGVVLDNKIWWGNLMYDGTHFYTTFKDSSDTSTVDIKPLYADASGRLWLTDSADESKLYYYDPTGSTYKGTTGKNFLVMNQFDNVSGIDKLMYSATLIFKKLVAGQAITVEYLTEDITSSSTWTTLGTASWDVDGGSVTEKALYFPINTTAKKIWYRVQLVGGGSNTPSLNDIVTAFLPRPLVDRQWRLNFDCGNALSLLNHGLENRTGRDLKGRLEQAWMTNQIVDFQDLDYAATAINDGSGITNSATTITVDSTAEFPAVGRLRVDDEIMYYTGKTPVSFTGVSRGQKGTKAVTHADNATVHNGFKVIIQSLNARVPVMNAGKDFEYVVGVSLREVI